MLDVRGAGGGVADEERRAHVLQLARHRHDAGVAPGRPDEAAGAAHRRRGQTRRSPRSRPTTVTLVVSRDIGGAENPGLYLLDPEGGALKLIQHTPKVQTSLAVHQRRRQVALLHARTTSSPTRTRSIATTSRPASASSCSTRRACGTSPITRATSGCSSKSSAARSRRSTSTTSKTQEAHAAARPERGRGVRRRTSARSRARCSCDEQARRLPAALRARGAASSTPISPEVKFDVAELRDRRGAQAHLLHDQRGRLRAARTSLDAKTFKPVALPKLPAADTRAVGGVVARRPLRRSSA